MRILLDERTAATGFHGIARVTTELAEALPGQLPEGWRLAALRLRSDPRAAAGREVIPSRSRPYSLGEQWELPPRVERDSANLYHVPTYWTALGIQKPMVITVYDLIPTEDPLLRSLVYRLGVGSLVRRARAVVTASESAAREVQATFGIDRNRIHVLPLGYDHIERSPAERPDILNLFRGTFCLVVGNPRPHKNLRVAVEAYRHYRRESLAPVELLVVGGSPDLADGSAGIRVVDSVRDGEMQWLRENACWAVFPSRREGFDLPLLEALATGCPALASDIAPHREIVGEEYPLFSPQVGELSEAMISWERNPELLEDLRFLGKRIAAPFTWARHARQIVELWRQVLWE